MYVPAFTAMPANNGGIGAPANNPSSVGGGFASQAVVRTMYDYNPLAIMQDVISRHDERLPDFRFWLKLWGFTKGSDAPVIGHYEMDWLNNLVKVGAIVTPSTGPGTDVVLELHPDSMFNTNATVNGAAAQGSFVRENNIILFGGDKRGWVKSKDITVTPHRITVSPLNATVNLAGATVVGTNYAVITNAWGEGTGLPPGVMTTIHKWTNQFQIIKEGMGASGSEASNSLFVNFVEVPNDPNSILAQMNHTMVVRFERQCSNALLFGEGGSTIKIFAPELGVDVNVHTTEGALSFGEQNGHIQTYTPGTLTLGEFNAAARVASRERIGGRVMMSMQGGDFARELEDVLRGEFNANPIVFVKDMARDAGNDPGEFYNQENIALHYGFKSVYKSGKNFLFKTLPEFDDVTLGAAYTGTTDTYKYPGYNVIFPMGNSVDGKGNKDFLFGYHYKARKGYSREAVFGWFGGVGVNGTPQVNTPTNQYDVMRCGLLAEIAGHFACGNRVIIQKPV